MKKALLQIHFAVFLWGFTGVLGRTITLTSVMLVWWRLLITVVSLWALFALRKKILLLPWREAAKISVVGFILSIHWVCFYGAIKLADITITLTCLSLSAFLTAIIEPLAFGKKIDPAEIFLGLFAVAGIAIIYKTHLNFSVGIVVGLIATLLSVCVSVMNKSLVGNYPAEQIMLYQLTGGWLGLSAMVPVYLSWANPAARIPTAMDCVWLVLLGWVCTIYTFHLWLGSLKKLSAFTMNLVLTMEPVYGILLAFMIYHENKDLNEWFYVGFSLVAFAVCFHTWRVLRGRITPEAVAGANP